MDPSDIRMEDKTSCLRGSSIAYNSLIEQLSTYAILVTYVIRARTQGSAVSTVMRYVQTVKVGTCNRKPRPTSYVVGVLCMTKARIHTLSE